MRNALGLVKRIFGTRALASSERRRRAASDGLALDIQKCLEVG